MVCIANPGGGEGWKTMQPHCLAVGHMEKQEMEMKWKLETETGNWKLKTEMEMQPLSCCSPSKIQLLLGLFLGIPVLSVFALLA